MSLRGQPILLREGLRAGTIEDSRQKEGLALTNHPGRAGAPNGIVIARIQQKLLGNVEKMESLGRKRWAIAEGYIPATSTGPAPQMTSHETVCLLNVSDRDVRVHITVFYADREPVGPYRLTVSARRTRHLRFNDLQDPEPIPRDTDFASMIEADAPIVVQHTRLDSRQAENALLSTMAFPGDS